MKDENLRFEATKNKWYWFALSIWSINVIASLTLRPKVIELYAGSNYRPLMGNSLWLLVPPIMILLIALGCHLRAVEQKLCSKRAVTGFFSFLGVAFLIGWLLQLVVDITG